MIEEMNVPKTSVIFIAVLITIFILLFFYFAYNSSSLQNIMKIFGLIKAVP